jgi:hypothetical protein
MRKNIISIFILLILAGIVLSFVVMLESEATIIEHSWKRSIDIEELITVTDSDWTLPENAILLYKQRELYGMTRVGKVSVPVYKTKYYYEQDVWKKVFISTSKGLDKNPYWNEVNLSKNQREYNRKESYFLTLKLQNGKIYTIKVDYNSWINLNLNENITVCHNIWHTIMKVKNN